ncbi:hypothetical protein BDN67DRAFT_1066072 [Paxillus ammoniavirescens]|nr:hypothetical protein BDN67DRAFT_1066072 [Paxillus ammoniavirescens]
MSSAALWLRFRRFRTVDLSIASLLCLVWSIIISIYTAKSWSSCDGSQRGFLLGLIVLDFFSAILIYLMIVVKYTFWPDVARTGVLLGLHSTGVMIFTMYTLRLPCVAFGSAAHCHTFMIGVLAGLWTVTSLLLAYGICLPFMAVIPSPPNLEKTGGDLEGRPVSVVKSQKREEEVTSEEKRKSRASAGSRAWLLGNQEGTSPGSALSGLPAHPRHSSAPRCHSHASSSPSSFNSAPPRFPTGRQIKFENPRGPSHPPVCWTVAHPIRAPYTSAAERSLNVSRSSLESPTSHSPYYSSSLRSLPLPTHLGGKGTNGNRVSAPPYSRYTSAHPEYEYPPVLVTLSAVNESTSSLSVYSQYSAQDTSTASTGAPLSPIGPNDLRSLPSRLPIGRQHRPSSFAPRSPGQDSVHSMRASVPVYGHPDQGIKICGPTCGFLPPLVTALPTSSFSASSGLTSFGLYPRGQSVDVGELHEIFADPPHYLAWQDSNARSPHVRNDSTSHVNMYEWRKLVMDAARKR